MKNSFSFLMICCALLVARPVLADDKVPEPPIVMPANVQPPLKAPAPAPVPARVPGGAVALTVIGATLFAGGTALTAWAGVSLGRGFSESGSPGPSFTLSLLFISGSMVVAGVVMLGVGATRIARYHNAQRLAYRDPAQRRPLLSGGGVAAPVQLSLAPILSRQMYGLAVSGRF